MSDFTPELLVQFDLVGDVPKPRPYVMPNLPRRKLLQRVPEEKDAYFFVVDNSSLETVLKCKRMGEYQMVFAREPDKSAAALVFGGALHRAIEVLMKFGVNEATIARGEGNIYEYFESRPVAVDEWRTPDQAVKIFKRYVQKYPMELFQVAIDTNGNPLVEIPFSLPLGSLDFDATAKYPPSLIIVDADDSATWRPTTTAEGTYIKKIYILWSGRMDAILTWDGQFWVMDHKTTSIGGNGFFNDFILSQQTMGYTWAAQKIINAPVAGLVLNALIGRKPTPTGKWCELERRRYPYSPEHLAEWETDILAIIADFFSSLKRGYFPKQTVWCQRGKYGQCKYHETCCLPPNQRMVNLNSNLFRDITWSPLHIDNEQES